MTEIHPSVYRAAQETFDRLWEHEESKTCLREAVDAAIAVYTTRAARATVQGEEHVVRYPSRPQAEQKIRECERTIGSLTTANQELIDTQNRLLSQLDVARDTIRNLESHTKEAANRTVQMRLALHGDIPVETVESLGYGLHRGNVVLAKEMQMENVGLKAEKAKLLEDIKLAESSDTTLDLYRKRVTDLETKLNELILANREYVGHRRETTWHRCKAGIKAYPTVLCSSHHEDESSNFDAVEALEQAEAALRFGGFQRGRGNGWKAPLARVQEPTLAEVVPFAYPDLKIRIHAAANKAIYNSSKPFTEVVVDAIIAGVLAAVEVKRQNEPR